ncbi:tubulin polyglutamylase complex subunit 2-like [Dendronephthya gigantea]|uniref:tubulin polyglutamylase complex subunit 2-like n=1 Tax=Dendronephthya gigantea TaxID=151771 RepID=UPI00106D7D97|nr:tubulin polyglutamylase complex subunit 2-like [Dendronephthya gigantea]XP_028399107.1 tubulin polyglutamylase complex subunit 2-like [Dendronephthya gigantea]
MANRGNEVRGLLDRMTLGVVKTLESKPGVCDVRFFDKKPADKSFIYSWEQKNMCALPKDLKDFYMTTDGISIQWSIKFDGSTLPTGNMEINSISNLTPINQSIVVSDDKPTLLDIDDLSDEEDSQGHFKPHFDERNKCFELDSCLGFAKVCLVYKDIVSAGFTNSSPEVWLLDRSLRWTYLSSSFQSYFRMLIVHLGLPLWQYRFTPTGLSPETLQWFNLYAPNRVEDCGEEQTSESGEASSKSKQEDQLVNHLDTNRVFKGKSDAMKPQTKQGRKKPGSNVRTNTSTRFLGTSGPRTHR